MAPPTETPATSKVYQGGCHCGANRYSTSISPPLDAPESKVTQCNCSVCSKNGYLFVFTKVADTQWNKGGPDAMTGYTFHECKIKHHFCPTCGTSVYCSSNKETFFPDSLVINVRKTPKSSAIRELTRSLQVRTIDDVDFAKLNLSPVDGKSL
jgi:hypothetical protein